MTQTPTPKHLLSTDYVRLQQIEEHVAKCVELAADCIDALLGKQKDSQSKPANQICREFLKQIQDVQLLIEAAVKASPTSRHFEATSEVYIAVYKAETAAAKLQLISEYLNDMQKTIKKGNEPKPRQEEQVQKLGDVATTITNGHGGGDAVHAAAAAATSNDVAAMDTT